MDTERIYRTHDELEEIAFAELDCNDLKAVRDYVEITRHLQEIHSLFLIFKFQIELMQKEYILMNDGKVFFNEHPANREEDYIAINAYVTNIISAGKTLVEAMDCFINMDYPPCDSGYKQEYLDYYHGIYDSSFAYRFMIRLRDYAQHGHLPVDNEKNSFCFNLINILKKPHYNQNKTLQKQMTQVADEVMDVYDDIPTLSLTLTLAEFVSKLLFIYQRFWTAVEESLLEAQKNSQEVLGKYPENIMNASAVFPGCFIYEVIDGWAHAINIADDSISMFSQFKIEAQDICDEYATAWSELTKETLKIRCVDKKRIEIELIE